MLKNKERPDTELLHLLNEELDSCIHVIEETYVRHKTWLPWAKDDSHKLLEQTGNKVSGCFKDGTIELDFINSLGIKSVAYGSYFYLTKEIMVVTAVAYGYPEYPEGRRIFGFGRDNKESKMITLKIPSLTGQYVSVVSSYSTKKIN